jgi:hypothetical protein
MKKREGARCLILGAELRISPEVAGHSPDHGAGLHELKVWPGYRTSRSRVPRADLGPGTWLGSELTNVQL